MSNAKTQLFHFLPQSIERTKSPHLLGPTEARQMQNVDTSLKEGQIRRGGGFQRLACAGVASQVYNCFTAVRPDGQSVLLYSTSGGEIACFNMDGTANGGILPIENDEDLYTAAELAASFVDDPTFEKGTSYTI